MQMIESTPTTIGENKFENPVIVESDTDLTPHMQQKLWQDSLDVVLMKALHCKSTKELKKKMASPCECHSGRKFKNCCGDNITHFAAQELAEQMKGNKDA